MQTSNKVDLPELYERLKEFTIESCNILSAHYKKKDYIGKLEGIPLTIGPDLQPFFFLQEPYLESLFYERYQELTNLKSFKILQKHIEKEKFMLSWHEAVNFVKFYFSLTKEFKFNQEIFDHQYNRYMAWKIKKQKRDLHILPLQHFYCDLEEITLLGDIKLRKLDPKEVWKINKYNPKYAATIDHQNTLFALEKIHSYELPSDDDWSVPSKKQLDKSDIGNQMHRVVTAFRIFKDGDLMVPLDHLYFPLDYETHPSGIGVSYPPILATQNPYKLNSDEVEEFKEFWKSIYKRKFNRKTQIALRRFESLYRRWNYEDNIIDCMIAFEALFGSQGRTRMMISLKSAFLLGEDKEEIYRIYAFQNKAYELRSSIVHGSKARLPFEIMGTQYNTLNEVVLETKRLLRLSLKKHLDGDVTDEIKEYFKIIKLLELNDGKAVITRIFGIIGDEKKVIES